jgi:hypothetical protein
MASRRIKAVAAAVGVAGLLQLVFAGAVSAGNQAHGAVNPALIAGQWGWVVARKPTTTNYAPAARDQGNSGGGQNTVTRSSKGFYTVRFGGLAATLSQLQGIVHVTAMASRPRNCNLNAWFNDNGDKVANLYCADEKGNQKDTKFVASYLNAGADAGGAYGYAYNDHPNTPGTTTPNVNFQYDTKGGTIHSNRTSTGHYTVTMPNLHSIHGNVQVTTVAAGTTVNCHLGDWIESGTDESITVVCVNGSGTAVDAQFVVSYTRSVGLKGVAEKSQAFLYAGNLSAATFTPSQAYRYAKPSGVPSVTRLVTGHYSVTLPTMPLGGGVQVTSFGNTSKLRCIVESIRTKTPQTVGIACFTPAGVSANSAFSLSYLN